MTSHALEALEVYRMWAKKFRREERRTAKRWRRWRTRVFSWKNTSLPISRVEQEVSLYPQIKLDHVEDVFSNFFPFRAPFLSRPSYLRRFESLRVFCFSHAVPTRGACAARGGSTRVSRLKNSIALHKELLIREKRYISDIFVREKTVRI